MSGSSQISKNPRKIHLLHIQSIAECFLKFYSHRMNNLDYDSLKHGKDITLLQYLRKENKLGSIWGWWVSKIISALFFQLKENVSQKCFKLKK